MWKGNIVLRYQGLLLSACLAVTAGYGLVPCLIVQKTTPERMEDDPELLECAACLPPGVTLDTHFARLRPAPDPEMIARLVKAGACMPQDRPDDRSSLTTVRQRLIELNAYAKDGTIYDSDGTPVFFYTPLFYRIPDGVCGNGLRQFVSLRERDAKQVETLDKKGIVVLLHPTCLPIQKDPDYCQRSREQLRTLDQATPGSSGPPR